MRGADEVAKLDVLVELVLLLADEVADLDVLVELVLLLADELADLDEVSMRWE